jgi:uncharacterized membrane protein YtjA (UPF0391 family)
LARTPLSFQRHLRADPLRAQPESIMLYWAASFFLIAILAAVLGFGGIADGAADIAKVLFFIFIVLFVVSFIVSLFSRGGRGRGV